MEIEILVPLVTCSESGSRAYEKGEVVAWPDRKDAQRLIEARYARAAQPKKG